MPSTLAPKISIRPDLCPTLLIHQDTEIARGEFRTRRLDNPLRDYNTQFPTARAAADKVVNALSRLLAVPANKALLSNLVGDKATYSALRSVAAPPISSDDLDTLLRNKVNKTALKRNQPLADSMAKLFTSCLDPERFPWVAGNRTASAAELEAAKLATAVLTAVSAVQAGRRGQESKDLEGRVAAVLLAAGYTRVPKPRGGITSNSQFPNPGEFMKTCKLGQHNADLVVRLFDKRLFPIECKASNSEVNGYKRLNKEVVVDAKDWSRRYGSDTVIPAAALRGVFKASNVVEAQQEGVYLFWWHRMDALAKFLAAAV